MPSSTRRRLLKAAAFVPAAVVPLRFVPPVREAKATAPDGTDVPVENRMVGAVRTTFDVHLKQQGTYRVAIVSDILLSRTRLAAFWLSGLQRK